MSDLYTRECSSCLKTKECCLFTPSRLKTKSPICRMCLSEQKRLVMKPRFERAYAGFDQSYKLIDPKVGRG